MKAAHLKCLGGDPVPPSLASDLARIGALHPSARQAFWDALGPSLPEPVPPDVGAQLDAFCSAHSVTQDDLAPALKAVRFLVREAARRDISANDLEADLGSLVQDAAVRAVVVGVYERARGEVQRGLLLRSLADHGNVVTGMAWRVDTVEASHHGLMKPTPIGVVTVVVQGGSAEHPMTLQITADHAKDLIAFGETLLRASRR
jgi:hypothetical protein